MARRSNLPIRSLGFLLVLGVVYYVATKPRGEVGAGATPVTSAKAQISAFCTALDLYKLDTGAYPTTAEGLDALVYNESEKNYLEQDVIPKDPWGSHYLYSSPGPKHAYEIVSMGADGRFGGSGEDADIYSWDLK